MGILIGRFFNSFEVVVVLVCEVLGRERRMSCLVTGLALLLCLMEVFYELVGISFIEIAVRTRIIDYESVELRIPSNNQDIEVAHPVQLDGFFE